jgi:hypothetical protein
MAGANRSRASTPDRFPMCLAVAGLCWRTSAVRWGALLSTSWLLRRICYRWPVGTNASRLPELYAAPIIVAVAAVVGVIVAVASVRRFDATPLLTQRTVAAPRTLGAKGIVGGYRSP